MQISRTWRQKIDALPAKKRSFVYGSLISFVTICLVASPAIFWFISSTADPTYGEPELLPFAITIVLVPILIGTYLCGLVVSYLTPHETKTLYLVRHGSVENPEGIICRRLPGFHLSADGGMEVKAARDALANISYQVIYHSPLERASETALLLNRRKVNMLVEERINEWDTGEHSDDVLARTKSFWQEFLSGPYSIALAVSHRDIIRTLLLHLQQEDLYPKMNDLSVMPLGPASIYKVVLSVSGVRIEQYFSPRLSFDSLIN